MPNDTVGSHHLLVASQTLPPSAKPPTNSLRIDNFLRPFTLKAAQELLGKSGTVVSSFWMDHIKTHCYVTKQGQHVHIKDCRKIDVNVCTIYVDGKVVATGTSDHKDIVRRNAAKDALAKFNQSDIHPTGFVCEVNDNNEIEAAKQKLHDACGKKKWPKPVYRIEKELGLTHEKTFICSVKIETAEVVLHMMGKEKSSKRHAENSAASMMIHSLVESNYV